MIKFRLYFDKDKETDWLNKMAARGWAMESFFLGFFRFKECAKGEYLYQVDFNSKFGGCREYREFMQEAGIEIVESWGFWTILRKPASEGEFELYTDLESKIAHYSKIRVLFKIAAIIEIICIWLEFTVASMENNWRYGVPFILFYIAVLAVFVRMAIHTTDIINDLREKQTGITVKKRRNISLLLAAGMLVNSVALIWNNEAPGHGSHLLQIVAIVLMLVGVWDIARKRER